MEFQANDGRELLPNESENKKKWMGGNNPSHAKLPRNKNEDLKNIAG